jgi:hypothetical protein
MIILQTATINDQNQEHSAVSGIRDTHREGAIESPAAIAMG